MLLTQEPTFVMVVTQEPTTHIYKKKREKEKLLPLMHFKIMEWFTVTYHHHVKLQLQSQKVLKRESMHSCMRTCKQSSWGECWATKRPHFIPLSYTIWHFIPILSFHKIINIHHIHNKYGFILPFSKSFIFLVFWVNLWLIIEKNNIFSLYFKVGWVWWCLQVNLKNLTSPKVAT